jgi:hypothetical protein
MEGRVMMRVFATTSTAAILVLTFAVVPSSGDHGAGVLVRDYMPRNDAEAAIVRLVRTVTEGWERKDVDLILSAYAHDAVQRAGHEPGRMIDRAGIRAEALGAFADAKLGAVRFEDWIHRIYIVNSSALLEINQKFHGWGRDHYYRDFWMFARREGRWRLIRVDYEPQPPFDRRSDRGSPEGR